MSKKVSKNYNSLLIEMIAERPVLFNAALARIAKSAIAGLFLSQLLYWWEKGNDKHWVYKTIREFEEETALNRSEQDRAIRIWKDLGVLIVERRGIPQKRYFHIFIPHLEKLIGEYRQGQRGDRATQFAESDKLIGRDVQTITESTQENTSRDHVLHTLRRPQNFDISAASKDLANKLSINKNQKP